MGNIQPFDTMDAVPIDKANFLLKPNDPQYQSLVYEATDAAVVRDFMTDPHLVPKGLVRDEGGHLRAIFWQRRTRS